MSSKVDWHARLGHPSHPYLKRLIEDVKVVDCVTCKMCKATKLPFKGKFASTSQVLEAIHLDLVGPFQTRSVGGAQYFLTIVDQFSGFKTIKLLKHKLETLNKFEEFVIWAENQTGKTIKRIISDNGGEFKNIFFEDFCRNRGISQQFSPPYTPENNGMSERSNRAILDKARCLFAQANLSPCYWAEAVVTATDLCNLLPSSTRNFQIPYKTFFGRDIKLSNLRSFGCMTYIFIPKETRTNKLLPRSEKAIFLGYVNDFSSYRFVRIESKTVCTTRNVSFDESIFPSLLNESLDQSSFFFNPFEIIPDDDVEEVNEFHPFPNQEQLIQDLISPSKEIIGDISSKIL
jgi:transposase InsO family protein